MLRKAFVRLCLCLIAFVGLVVASACLAGFLALQEPAFYAERRAQQFSESDQTAARTFFELTASDLRLWSNRSLATQLQQSSGSTTPASPFFGASLGEYDPAHDARSVRITEKQINAQLASGKASVNREWRNPRIHLGQDRIDVGFEIVTPKATCVLSAELKPTWTSEGRLRLDLVTARIGRLPFRPLLRWLPRDVNYSGNDVELDLTAPTPYVCFNLSGDGPKSPSVKSLTCTEGEMTIEFLAPVLKREQAENGATPLALSGRD